MRKIDEQMIAAIEAGKNWKCGNTEVSIGYEASGNKIIQVKLHGHVIAVHNHGKWLFTLAGYNTQVTRRRVDALCSVFGGPERRGVYTKAGQLYVKRYSALVRDPSGVDQRITASEWF